MSAWAAALAYVLVANSVVAVVVGSTAILGLSLVGVATFSIKSAFGAALIVYSLSLLAKRVKSW